MLRRTDLEGAFTLKFSAGANCKPTIETHCATHKRYWTDFPESQERTVKDE
jgi:hypothetical protein